MKATKKQTAKKKPGTGRPRGRPPKTAVLLPPKEKAAAPASYKSEIDAEGKSIFLQTMPKIAKLKADMASANANLRNAYKAAKADGFLKADFDFAFELQKKDGDKIKKRLLHRQCTIASWLARGIVAKDQLDLFADSIQMPSVEESAYDEGAEASAAGKTAKPVHAPGTPGYENYMKGYHDHQASLMKAGIKPLPEDAGEDEIEGQNGDEEEGMYEEELDETEQEQAAHDAQQASKIRRQAAADQARDDGGFEPTHKLPGEQPASGVPMTRSQFRAQQEAQDPGNGGSLFQRK